MKILAIDPGKNTGLCIFDTETDKYYICTLTFKSSQDAFIHFAEEFNSVLIEQLDELDKVILEFSPFGILNAQLSHFFYVGTIFGVINRFWGDNIYQMFNENKSSKYGVQANVWQSFIASKLGIKPKEFDKSQSIKFANSILNSKNIKVASDHESDAFCICYWYVNKYLNLG